MIASPRRDKLGGALRYFKGRVKRRSRKWKRRASGVVDQVTGALRNKRGHLKDWMRSRREPD